MSAGTIGVVALLPKSSCPPPFFALPVSDGHREQESSRPPTALEVWPQTYGSGKTPTPSKLGSTRGVQDRANRTPPRTRHQAPDASLALPAPPQRQTPKVALTTESRGRRAVVRRRRDVVLRHEGLEHLRLRRPQTQTLQSQEHGRSENSTRGLPCHLLNVLIPYPLSQVTRRHHKN